jgi:hypothetical protein
MNSTPLGIGDAFALGDLLNAITAHKRVKWLDADGEIREGELRHVVAGATDWGFLRGDEDVRDAHVRVTTAAGIETTFAVRDAMSLLRDGGMVFDSDTQ